MPSTACSAASAGPLLKSLLFLNHLTILATILSLASYGGFIIPMKMRKGLFDKAEIPLSVALEPFM